jgi:hypothetical protein
MSHHVTLLDFGPEIRQHIMVGWCTRPNKSLTSPPGSKNRVRTGPGSHNPIQKYASTRKDFEDSTTS